MALAYGSPAMGCMKDPHLQELCMVAVIEMCILHGHVVCKFALTSLQPVSRACFQSSMQRIDAATVGCRDEQAINCKLCISAGVPGSEKASLRSTPHLGASAECNPKDQ